MGGVLGIGVRTMTEAVILAAVIAMVAPLGDLFESMLKRDLGVKDMSDLIPSHGGLLDRFDALLFTLPASYYTLRMLGVIALIGRTGRHGRPRAVPTPAPAVRLGWRDGRPGGVGGIDGLHRHTDARRARRRAGRPTS